MKQDRTSIRGNNDTELRLQAILNEVKTQKKAVQQSENDIVKTNQTLEDFVVETLKSIEDIQNQIDGVIESHFYTGVPTLDNLPASEWTTEQDKADHLGDLYYDQDTGAVYRFIVTDGGL